MISRQSQLGIQWCGCAATICLSIMAPGNSLAQANAFSATSASLPPEAHSAVKKGVIAAQEQDYSLALRFFQDAQKLAPDASEVLYNFGRQNQKSQGGSCGPLPGLVRISRLARLRQTRRP